MRSATKTFVGLAGIGVMIAAARAGLPVPTSAQPVSDGTESTATPTPTATATETPTATPKPTATKKASSSSSGSGGTAASSGSKTSAAVSYKYGVVQVKVTKSSGKITSVDLVRATATKGRDSAFPSLVQATIDNNGTNFGNLSGATYTVNAFKKAVKSALAKF